MPMDGEDHRYFTQQFGLVHKRITESEKSQTGELHKVTEDQNKKIAEIQSSIETHKVESSTHNGAAISAAAAAAMAAVKEHNDESWVHNPVKTWTLIGAIAGVFTAIGAGLMWIFKHFKP
jgi:hypothetical protein